MVGVTLEHSTANGLGALKIAGIEILEPGFDATGAGPGARRPSAISRFTASFVLSAAAAWTWIIPANLHPLSPFNLMP
jgi:hypothetical protein